MQDLYDFRGAVANYWYIFLIIPCLNNFSSRCRAQASRWRFLAVLAASGEEAVQRRTLSQIRPVTVKIGALPTARTCSDDLFGGSIVLTEIGLERRGGRPRRLRPVSRYRAISTRALRAVKLRIGNCV